MSNGIEEIIEKNEFMEEVTVMVVAGMAKAGDKHDQIVKNIETARAYATEIWNQHVERESKEEKLIESENIQQEIADQKAKIIEINTEITNVNKGIDDLGVLPKDNMPPEVWFGYRVKYFNYLDSLKKARNGLEAKMKELNAQMSMLQGQGEGQK